MKCNLVKKPLNLIKYLRKKQKTNKINWLKSDPINLIKNLPIQKKNREKKLNN